MSGAPRAPRKGRWSTAFARVREKLARSRQVFLIGLVVACGIEVMVDWNSTLFEINVLRGRVKERGQSYVHILSAAVDEAMVARDQVGLAAMSEGVFADEDVVFVRFVDATGALLYERLEPEYGKRFQDARGRAFEDTFARQMNRDLDGVMNDPAGQRARMLASKWRDFPQRWNDAVNALMERFVAPTPPRAGVSLVLYQEALRTADHEREAGVTYAFGTVVRPAGKAGALLVAFSMDRTNEAIRNKYLKGLGMVLFFIGLILVQNLSSRQDKLRLLDLETRYGRAKAAVIEALPGVVRQGALWATGALEQSEEKVDGQLFALHASESGLDVLLVDPDGEGIESAAVALQVRAAFLSRRGQGPLTDLVAEAEALGRASAQIPLSRPLGLHLLHVGLDGGLAGVMGPAGGARLLRQGAEILPEPMSDMAAPAGVVGPLRRFEARLSPGEALVIASAGLDEPGRQPLDVGAVAAFVRRSAGTQPLREDAMTDAASWARGQWASLAERDVAVVVVAMRASP